MRTTTELVAADRRAVWHPFTQMQEYLATEPLVQAIQVFSVMTIQQHQIDEPFGELRGSNAGQHLDVGELVGDVLRAGDEADAQAARQRLGKAARIDHAVELIKRREPGGRRAFSHLRRDHGL